MPVDPRRRAVRGSMTGFFDLSAVAMQCKLGAADAPVQSLARYHIRDEMASAHPSG